MSDGDPSGGKHARGPYSKGIARRHQIIRNAIEEFAERGVDGTSLRTLGEAIGVSHATLRHYFASRDELLVEVYREHEERVTAGAGFEGGAVETIAASAERNRAIPGLVRLYATLATDALQEAHPISTEFIGARFRQLRASLADSIREGQDAGRIAPDIDPVDAAALIIAASDGLQVQWLLAPDEVDVRRSLTLLERLFPGSSDTSR
ncbi:TetR/AcrR family transcriptional regulator [Gryllotalpicola koreensis]|uniref:TetR/AcrR family transcriptional regulator n=1 Tax=Gryllotalpicola koreensis TaxID=993086 RepID=A0ABP8AC54_9MICO